MMSYAAHLLDDDTPMWDMELLRMSHLYAEEKCPDQKLGRMNGDDSPLKQIEIIQEAFYEGTKAAKLILRQYEQLK